jgi:hypothetical protein
VESHSSPTVDEESIQNERRIFTFELPPAGSLPPPPLPPLQVSISTAFYEHLFYTKMFLKLLSTYSSCSYFLAKNIGKKEKKKKKQVYKVLLKLSTSDNITKILQAPFMYERVLHAAFLCLQIGFLIFWRKEIRTKVALKILFKLTSDLQ